MTDFLCSLKDTNGLIRVASSAQRAVDSRRSIMIVAEMMVPMYLNQEVIFCRNRSVSRASHHPKSYNIRSGVSNRIAATRVDSVWEFAPMRAKDPALAVIMG